MTDDNRKDRDQAQGEAGVHRDQPAGPPQPDLSQNRQNEDQQQKSSSGNRPGSGGPFPPPR